MHHGLPLIQRPHHRWRCAAALLISSAALPGHVFAQTVAEGQALDSLLIHMVDAPAGVTLPSSLCNGMTRPLMRLCEGFLLTRHERVALVIPEVRQVIFNVRGPDQRTSAALMQGILKFNQVIFERPRWGPGYFALAQVVLDYHKRPDSALKLLHTARGFGGMPLGLIDLTIARAYFEKSERTLGWNTLVQAARDSSTLTQAFVVRLLARFLPPNTIETYSTISHAERGPWISTTPGLSATLGDGLSFRPPFRIRVRNYSLERDGTGNAVVSFSLGTLELLGDTLADGRGHFPILTSLIATREGDGRAFRIDSLRQFVGTVKPPRASYGKSWCATNGVIITTLTPCVPDALNRINIVHPTLEPPDPWMQATTELPLPPGRYFLTLTLSQEDGKRGVTTMLPPVTIPPMERTTLTMSDLVLGWDGHGVPWQSGTRTIPLNPYSEWSPDAAMTLYAQLSGLKADADYRVQLDVVSLDPKRASDGQGNRRLNFTEHAVSDRVEWYREMSVKGLLPGPYRVTVSVTQGEVTLRRSEEIVVVK